MRKIIFFAVLTALLILIPLATSSAEEETVEVMVLYKTNVHKNSVKLSSVQDEIPIHKMTVPVSEVEKLKNNPNVEAVSTRKKLKLYGTTASSENRPDDENLFNLQLVNTYEAWDKGYTGKGVKIAVIDTGFATHQDLKLAGGKSFIVGEKYTSDGVGHGTHVSGTINALRNGEGIAGVAPDAKVYGLKVFDEEGFGTSFELIEALEWAIENNMDIVNMSLGLDEDDAVLKATIKRAAQKGILLVAASGNEYGDPVSYPARYNEVIAVASVDENKIHSPFSNIGRENDLSAPGENICSTVPNNDYDCWEGTSMATPHVTGLLALLKERFPNYASSTLRKYITESAEDLGTLGHDNIFGYGLAKYVEPTSSIPSSNITVEEDILIFHHLEVNSFYSIYKDSDLKTKITSFTADNESKTIHLQQLGNISNEIYITVKKQNYGESEPTKVTINKLPSLSANNVIVTNHFEKDDEIIFNGLKIGYTYKVFQDKGLTKLLTSFEAKGTTETITVPQLGAKAGEIYVVVSKAGYTSSFATKVPFPAETIPSIKAENVMIINNTNKEDELTFKDLKVGFTYEIYSDEGLTKQITFFEATEPTKTIKVPQVGDKAGAIYIVVRKEGYNSSLPTKVTYPGEQLPALKGEYITVTNNYGASDKITFKGLTIGNTYTAYSDKKLNNSLISFTATDETKTVSVQLIGANAGIVYVVVSKEGYVASTPTAVSYKTEQLPALKAGNVTITNNYKASDKIVFNGLIAGLKYTVYSDARLTKSLSSFVATSTTKTVTVPQVGAKAGVVYVVASKTGYLNSLATKVSFKDEKLSSLAAKNVTITNKAKSDKIVLKGLTKGFTYTIYTDSKLKKRLAYFTATSTAKTLTVTQVGAKEGAVYIVVSKSGYLSSSATKVSFKGEPTTAISAKKVKITNKKKEDTIKFTGLKKGATIVIYKDAKKKKKLVSFTATSTTKTVKIQQLGKKAGKIYITAQLPGYSVSTTTTVSYPKEK